MDTLVEMAKLTAEVSGSRVKKLEILKKRLSENHDFMDLKVSFSNFFKILKFLGSKLTIGSVNSCQKYSS